MRVLMVMTGGDKVPGGHAIQIDQTARFLRELGVDVTVTFDDSFDFKEFDIIHGFGLSPNSIRRFRTANVPVMLSTIYCSKEYTTGNHIRRSWMQKWQQRARFAAVLGRSAFLGSHIEKCEAIVNPITVKRVTYEMADLLLPNSESEARQIEIDLEVTTPMHVVPNAVDPTLFKLPKEGQDIREGILYVGRFEPHKNQLGLILAMRGVGIPLTLVGHAHPHHRNYLSQCRQAADDSVAFIDGIAHAKLPALYQRAKVHVLPSWFETTGLVSLEAALCGCNIVTTDRGYARDYFKDLAWYCDPADKGNIRQSIMAAYTSKCSENLRELILSRFTWRHTAEATLQAYQKVINLQINVRKHRSLSGQ